MMPAMFTCGRTAGWCAHILEQKRLGKLVRPRRIYVGPGPRSPESVEGWDKVAREVVDRRRRTASPTFASAASSDRRAGARNPVGRWDGAGLGEWDLRALVGHASRSLITVSTYLQRPAQRRRTSPHRSEYYARINEHPRPSARAGIVERGQAGGP